MKNYDEKHIRNIAFIGSAGSGKTTLAEQMLFNAKMTSRVGKVEDGNTVMDSDADEIDKRMSIAMGIAHMERKNAWINLIDTPGYPDFIGEQIASLTGVESAMVVINAAGMWDVGLEQAFENISHRKMARGVIVNRMDNEHADYDKVLEMVTDNTDFHPAPIFIPIGREGSFQGVVDLVKGKAFINDQPAEIPADLKDQVEEYQMRLTEAVAEADDTLMEKYLESGTLNHDDLVKGVKKGIIKGNVIPVFACSGGRNIGVDTLLDAFIEYLPSPADLTTIDIDEDGEIKSVKKGDDKLLAYIFKSFADPNIGDIAYVRVFNGVLRSGMDIYIPEKDAKDKIGGMYYILGKNRKDCSELRPGEIGGLVKLKSGRGLNSIVSPGSRVRFPAVDLPTAVYWQSIKAVNQSDEDKIGGALARLLDEDPTAHADFDPETHEQVISGMGEQQIGLIQKRLKSRFKVEAELKTPRIPYRETITGNSDVSYRHKKQSGGRGQYGEVYFRVKPVERGKGFEFVNAIVGGVIPGKFIPAIEKGLVESMEKGLIAGYQVVDICVECYYGSYHDVDSSEMAFKIAASMALKDGFKKASPILLEPIHEVQIIIPVEYMGDVMGDISTRRGKILGMEQKGKKQILNAQLPLAELYSYFPALKSLTQGRGRFNQRFSFFERVPYEIADKVIAEFKDQD